MVAYLNATYYEEECSCVPSTKPNAWNYTSAHRLMFEVTKIVRALQTAMDWHPIRGSSNMIRELWTSNRVYRYPLYRKTGKHVASARRSVTRSLEATREMAIRQKNKNKQTKPASCILRKCNIIHIFYYINTSIIIISVKAIILTWKPFLFEIFCKAVNDNYIAVSLPNQIININVTNNY